MDMLHGHLAHALRAAGKILHQVVRLLLVGRHKKGTKSEAEGEAMRKQTHPQEVSFM